MIKVLDSPVSSADLTQDFVRTRNSELRTRNSISCALPPNVNVKRIGE